MIGLFLNLLDTQSEKDKFIKLYDKYKNMLYWISYGKTQSCQDAEECVQETFFYVAKHFEKIGDVNSSKTKGYLATIVTGFSIDVYNKSKKYGRIDIENNNMAENLSYFDNIETVELSSAIESVLSEEEKGKGEGTSKKEAEQNAAKIVIDILSKEADGNIEI